MKQRTPKATMNSLKLLRNSGSQNILECNIALVGVLNVGKSALTVKYITRRFIGEYDPHIEDIYTKPETVDGQDVLVRIMDTYDQEGSDPHRYLAWADALVVVYSITSRQSFNSAQCYLEMISQVAKETEKVIPTVLVGNKMDLERYRQVSKREGIDLAEQFESLFFETTAAEEYEFVEKLIADTIRLVQKEQEQLMPLKTLYISEERGGLSSLLNPSGNATIARSSFKRAKSPKARKESGDGKESGAQSTKKQSQSFKVPTKLKDIFSKQ